MAQIRERHDDSRRIVRFVKRHVAGNVPLVPNHGSKRLFVFWNLILYHFPEILSAQNYSLYKLYRQTTLYRRCHIRHNHHALLPALLLFDIESELHAADYAI